MDKEEQYIALEFGEKNRNEWKSAILVCFVHYPKSATNELKS
jgi:hypothetical protein